MNDAKQNLVECDELGPQQATFVCQHIVSGLRENTPYGFWWSGDSDSARPDAWCTACDEFLMSHGGGWNDESEAFAGVTLLFGSCYDRAKEMNVGRK